jgi:hypothetical protein
MAVFNNEAFMLFLIIMFFYVSICSAAHQEYVHSRTIGLTLRLYNIISREILYDKYEDPISPLELSQQAQGKITDSLKKHFMENQEDALVYFKKYSSAYRFDIESIKIITTNLGGTYIDKSNSDDNSVAHLNEIKYYSISYDSDTDIAQCSTKASPQIPLYSRSRNFSDDKLRVSFHSK